MSDDSGLWDDTDVNWQELSLAVIEPVPSDALTAPTRLSTPTDSNAASPEPTLNTEPTLVAESSYASTLVNTLSATLLNAIQPVVTGDIAVPSSHVEEQVRDVRGRPPNATNASHQTFSGAKRRETSMSKAEKESRKRSIQGTTFLPPIL